MLLNIVPDEYRAHDLSSRADRSDDLPRYKETCREIGWQDVSWLCIQNNVAVFDLVRIWDKQKN